MYFFHNSDIKLKMFLPLRSESRESNTTIADHHGICGFNRTQGIALDVVVQIECIAFKLAHKLVFLDKLTTTRNLNSATAGRDGALSICDECLSRHLMHRQFDDLLEGMVRVMASKYHSPINLGNPEEVSVLDLAHKVLELTKSSSEIKFQTLPQDDPCRRCPDISLARKNLDGWKPKVSLEKGLLKTIVKVFKYI